MHKHIPAFQQLRRIGFETFEHDFWMRTIANG